MMDHTTLYEGEKYYTVYREPSTEPEISSKYFDERGREVNPVDLLFEDSTKKSGSSKYFKKFGKQKKVLPCIGALELEYTTKSKARDTQLNIMPSFTTSTIQRRSRREDNAIVDTMFEDVRYDSFSNSYRKQEKHPERKPTALTGGKRELANEKKVGPKDEPKDNCEEATKEGSVEPETPYTMPSLWDCVTYVASFLPPVPFPEVPVVVETKEEEETKPPPVPRKDEIPVVPAKPLPPAPKPTKMKKIKSKIYDFAYSEPAQREQPIEVVRGDEYRMRGNQENFNRTVHPNFNSKSQRRSL